MISTKRPRAESERTIVGFVGESVEPDAGSFDPAVLATGVPGLPTGFTWRGERLDVATIVRSWRSNKEDRGDVYLDRLWFEFMTVSGARAIVYFDKHAKRAKERWRLYTLDEPESAR